MSASVCLTVAQGPQQLLLARAVIASMKALNPGRRHVLLLGGFYAGELANRLEHSCRLIAGEDGFDSVVSLVRADADLIAGKVNFASYIAELLTLLDAAGVTEVAEIIVARNLHPVNEAVLHAFARAKKIFVGDGLGIIDYNSAHLSPPLLSSGFVQPDELRTVLPCAAAARLFAAHPPVPVPPDDYIEVVDRAEAALEGAGLLGSVLDFARDREVVVLLMANLTEAAYTTSVENELAYFEESALPWLTPGMAVWVKGHPRHTMSQGTRLAERLRELNFDAFHDADADHLPVEVFARRLRVKLLLSVISSSCVSWKLLSPETMVVLGTADAIASRWLVTTDYPRRLVKTLYVQALMAERRLALPITMSEIERHAGTLEPAPLVLAPLSKALDDDSSRLIHAVVEDSQRAIAAADGTLHDHRHELMKEDDLMLQGILSLPFALGEKAALIRQHLGREAIKARGAENKKTLQKLQRRHDACAGELAGMKGSLCWKLLRWLFKLEAQLRSALRRKAP